MNSPATEPLETILRLCAAAAPAPWYPKQYAADAGVSRDALDPPLERLRLGGFIQLTDWVEGNGQGYALTPAGRRALQDPRDLDRLRAIPTFRADTTPQRPPRPREGDATTYERGETIRDALLSPVTPWVTYTLLAANVLWYLYAMRLAQAQGMNPGTFLSSDTPQFILRKTGGIHGSYLLSGDKWQWGRLLLCCFVHGNLLHLFMNMLGLYWVGPLIERMWGHVRFLVIYLIAGLGGSCVMLIKDPNVLGVGASGAIWGIMTSMAAWIILNRKFMPPSLVSNWLRQLLFLFVLNVGIGFVPGISMAAHLGGGALGAAAAVLLNFHRFGRGALRWLALAGALILPVLCVATLMRAMTVDTRWAALREMGGNEPLVKGDRAAWREMNDELMPSALRVEKRALSVYDSVARPLRDQHPTRRNPEEVRQALDALERSREQLAEQAERFAQAGPYQDTHIDDARRARQELLEARAKLFEMTEQYLRDGANKEDSLNEQEERVTALEKRWESFLR